MLEEKLSEYRPAIAGYIDTFLTEQTEHLTRINSWGDDVSVRLRAFAGQGKALRGCLVCATAEMYGRKVDEGVLAMAAAIELMHASLLVHDDIMDNDLLRRGQPTLLAQYQTLGQENGAGESLAYGQALATCVGDLGFFMSWQLLSRSGQWSIELSNLFGQEMAAVCLAQMEDVAAGLGEQELSEEQIIEIYRYKTARYTFSLPMMCGAMLANQKQDAIKDLESLGEFLGLMFQMKDDELGLFGDPEQTGKPVGSDVVENKKTLLRLWLLQAAQADQQKSLRQIFAGGQVDEDQLSQIRYQIDLLGVRVRMDKEMESWARAALSLIDELTVEKSAKIWLQDLVAYNQARTR